MRRLLRIILLRPIIWLSAKFASRPDKKRIFAALTELFQHIIKEPGKKGVVIPFEQHAGSFIIFSDQHKGRRNGADDFMPAERTYLAALDHYAREDFYYINLGDSEELWENSIRQVRKKNITVFDAEKRFVVNNKYIKIVGNHDLYWTTSFLASSHLQAMYGEKIPSYEGLILRTEINPAETSDRPDQKSPCPFTIFLTHGHQGDAQSDGNWFSKFFVGWIWAPLQALLRLNPNTPAYDASKKTLHNDFMYEWSSAQEKMILVTGHTHQPVFASLTHLERLYKQFQFAKQGNDTTTVEKLINEIRKREREFSAVSLDYMSMKPTYFNSGCCCYNDGDITGIEITGGLVRLIKWSTKMNQPRREVLEEMSLESLSELICYRAQ